MTTAVSDYAGIEDRLARDGLIARGGFPLSAADTLPESLSVSGRPPAALVMVGNAGPEMWHQFSRSSEHAERQPHALDRWTRRVLTRAAQDMGAEVRFPFEGPPYLPFLSWAKRAEAVFSSPLGMLVHPDYGLWHAYRGALFFAAPPAGLPAPDARPHPCETCRERPCLSACPVEAFKGAVRGPVERAVYDVAACKAHVAAAEGRACLTGGCQARRACPLGQDWAYQPAQAEFHMRAFVGASAPSPRRRQR